MKTLLIVLGLATATLAAAGPADAQHYRHGYHGRYHDYHRGYDRHGYDRHHYRGGYHHGYHGHDHRH